jgi:hypothetical protein
LIICFGADDQAGGCGIDEDIFVQYNEPDLTIKRVQYKGLWGNPQKGDEIILTMSKPFSSTDNAIFLDSLHILTDLTQQDVPDARKGAPVSFREINLRGKVTPHWIVGGFSEDRDSPRHHNPENSILALYNDANSRGEYVQQILPTMALNLDITISSSPLRDKYGITETSSKESALSPEVYGPEVVNYYRAPVPVPLYNGENRGIMIEKF